MTKPKHTPAPWTVINGGSGVMAGPEYVRTRRGYPPEDNQVCVLDDGEYIENPNRQADAHLIAAAPELLEACRVMTRYCEVYHGLLSHRAAMTYGEITKARAAIKKAEGDQ